MRFLCKIGLHEWELIYSDKSEVGYGFLTTDHIVCIHCAASKSFTYEGKSKIYKHIKLQDKPPMWRTTPKGR